MPRKTPPKVAFRVSYDANQDGYIVHQALAGESFAMVPVDFAWYFGSNKPRALEQVRRLHAWQAKGNLVSVVMIETPERFGALSDKKHEHGFW